MSEKLTLEELAKKTNSTFEGDPKALFLGVNDLAEADSQEISFLANPRYLADMQKSKAGCIIMKKEIERSACKNYLFNDDPSRAFQALIEFFYKDRAFHSGFSGVHERATVHPSAVLGKNVTICPNAVLDAEVVVGDNTFVGANVFIGSKSVIGSNSHIHPNAVILQGCRVGNNVIIQPGAVIGSCGFGYTQDAQGRHQKLTQLGSVVIEDDVEIGANTTIDRARFKETKISQGTKIDNLVQIAHGVIIGKHSMVIAQAGLAGSCKIGNHVILAGKVAVNGHIHICDHVLVAACSGVSKSINIPGKYAGVPVMPLSQHNKTQVYVRNIESFVQELRKIQKAQNSCSTEKK